jgi:hypothetical protein
MSPVVAQTDMAGRTARGVRYRRLASALLTSGVRSRRDKSQLVCLDSIGCSMDRSGRPRYPGASAGAKLPAKISDMSPLLEYNDIF